MRSFLLGLATGAGLLVAAGCPSPCGQAREAVEVSLKTGSYAGVVTDKNEALVSLGVPLDEALDGSLDRDAGTLTLTWFDDAGATVELELELGEIESYVGYY